MYAMNLNFKLTSQKSKLAHYEENIKTLYTFYSGVSKCVLIQCVMQMTGYALKENLCWLQKPGDSEYMSGDFGHHVMSIRLRNRSIRTSCTEHRKQQVITIKISITLSFEP
jgi:hypothetical protein